MNILITGSAGFIGFHTAHALLEQGHKVLGIDNLNNYYDPDLKLKRLSLLTHFPNFTFAKADITEYVELLQLARDHEIEYIIHLAAQAGVRYSLEHPFSYSKNNLEGHLCILELCRNLPSFKRLVYASSSSVYGANQKIPYSESDRTDSPVSLYAATKKSCEIMSHSYNHLYNLPMIGLRFFTVYGPYGRPDMAPFIFTDAIIRNKPINLFHEGQMERDFTYIDDIVTGVISALTNGDTRNGIYNLGNSAPIKTIDFLHLIEEASGNLAIINHLPMQKGEVLRTFADVEKAGKDLGFRPKTSTKNGVLKLVEWYLNEYQL